MRKWFPQEVLIVTVFNENNLVWANNAILILRMPPDSINILVYLIQIPQHFFKMDPMEFFFEFLALPANDKCQMIRVHGTYSFLVALSSLYVVFTPVTIESNSSSGQPLARNASAPAVTASV